MKIARLPIFFLVSTIVIISFGAGETQGQEIIINDKKIPIQFKRVLETAMKDGHLVEAAKLREQLKRKQCGLKLSADAKPGEKLMTSREIYVKRIETALIFGSIAKGGNEKQRRLSFAGATVLTSDGVVATNYHVLKSDKAIGFGAMNYKGEFFPAIEVLAASEVDDVALVRLKAKNLKPARLGFAKVGDPVVVISNPDMHFFSLSSGIASRYAFSRSKPGGKVLEISAEFARGSSGSPVFGNFGEVVGIVASTRSVYYNVVDGDRKKPSNGEGDLRARSIDPQAGEQTATALANSNAAEERKVRQKIASSDFDCVGPFDLDSVTVVVLHIEHASVSGHAARWKTCL